MNPHSQSIIAGTLVLFGSVGVQAHPGAHGADGAMATLGHLLLQHGWLPLLVTAAVLLVWRRARPAAARPRRREGGR